MSNIRIPKRWEIEESAATPENLYLTRRRFLGQAGLAGLGALAMTTGCAPVLTPQQRAQGTQSPESWKELYPAPRVAKYTIDRPLTDERVAARYNNFYEFTTDKEGVSALAAEFPSYPWQVDVAGLVRTPKTYDIDELLRMVPLEERLYRHRCVEAWSMAVPWTGIPFATLVRKLEPLSGAKFVRFVSFLKPELAAGQAMQDWYSWPYYEGVTMAEATNELTLLATGIYGHPMPMQHGAPIRLVTPWKYGYKSIKSIVRMEFVETQPSTFWNDVAPEEYGFTSNVDPGVPHPRWSQAAERLIDTGERIPTRPFNGYGEFVAPLYA